MSTWALVSAVVVAAVVTTVLFAGEWGRGTRIGLAGAAVASHLVVSLAVARRRVRPTPWRAGRWAR